MSYNKKPKRKTDCWIWPYGVNGSGYGSVGRRTKGVLTSKDAHKFIYEMLKGKIPPNCELDHICKNKLCVNPEHLEPVSHAVNCQRGKNAKLNIEQVKDIHRLSAKFTNQEIAKRYGVSRQCITSLLSGRTWKA